MNHTLLIHFLAQMLLLVLYLSAPVLVVAASVGLLVGLFQAVTQIQDQSLPQSFKLIAVMLTLVLLGGLLARPLLHQTTILFGEVASIR